MKNKYYTPEIEEFNPWFEFEYYMKLSKWKEGQVNGCTKMTVEGYTITPGERTPWLKCDSYMNFDEYDNSGLYEVKSMIEKNQIRVKYLDREDIESLDWEFKLNGFSEDGESTFDKFQRGDKFLLCEDNNYVIIWMENLNSVIYFRGYIKNKSELKRILKQIGV